VKNKGGSDECKGFFFRSWEHRNQICVEKVSSRENPELFEGCAYV